MQQNNDNIAQITGWPLSRQREIPDGLRHSSTTLGMLSLLISRPY